MCAAMRFIVPGTAQKNIVFMRVSGKCSKINGLRKPFESGSIPVCGTEVISGSTENEAFTVLSGDFFITRGHKRGKP